MLATNTICKEKFEVSARADQSWPHKRQNAYNPRSNWDKIYSVTAVKTCTNAIKFNSSEVLQILLQLT